MNLPLPFCLHFPSNGAKSNGKDTWHHRLALAASSTLPIHGRAVRLAAHVGTAGEPCGGSSELN